MSSKLSNNAYVPAFDRNGHLTDPKACCRAKYVPDFVNGGYRLASIASFNRPVFNTYGSINNPRKDADFTLPEDELVELTQKDSDGDPERSIRRARNAIFDLCLCNNFNLFCTFTYDPKKIDSTSYADVYKPLKEWLSNRVQRHDLKYVCVPEHHKDGEKIHFHLLCNKEALERDLVDSSYRRIGKANVPKERAPKGKVIYNIKSWRFGHSTALEITGDKALDFTTKYVLKYMTKQEGMIGGRRYLSGGDLQRPLFLYSDSLEQLWDGTPATYERTYNLGFAQFTELSYL